MFSPLLHRLQKLHLCHGPLAMTQPMVSVTPRQLIERLPALGSVLYMPMRSSAAQMLNMPSGFLVEALPLAPLMRTQWITVASVITVEGPREWLACFDAHGHECARLHLLPDTDYLAWDALLGGCDTGADLPLSALACDRSPASAQMLRFRSYALAGLCVLGADMCCRTSRLSRQLAGRIAYDEALPLQMATGS